MRPGWMSGAWSRHRPQRPWRRRMPQARRAAARPRCAPRPLSCTTRLNDSSLRATRQPRPMSSTGSAPSSAAATYVHPPPSGLPNTVAPLTAPPVLTTAPLVLTTAPPVLTTAPPVQRLHGWRRPRRGWLRAWQRLRRTLSVRSSFSPQRRMQRIISSSDWISSSCSGTCALLPRRYRTGFESNPGRHASAHHGAHHPFPTGTG